MLQSQVQLGEKVPSFEGLLGTDGETYGLASFRHAPILVVVFASNGCPSVKALEPWIVDFQQRYESHGVRVVWINSNNPSLSPPDTYTEMVRRAETFAYAFPYLKDEDRTVARNWGAVSTPHVFVLDEQRKLRYRGRVADSRQASEISEAYVESATDDLLAGRDVRISETEPYGCSIVW